MLLLAIRRRMVIGARRGLTLIELLILMAIISIVAALILASVNRMKTKSRNVQRLGDLATIQQALEKYIDEHNYLPPTNETSGACETNGAYCREQLDLNSPMARILIEGNYLDKIPSPPTFSSTDHYYYSEWGGSTSENHTHYALESHLEPGRVNPDFAPVGVDVSRLSSCFNANTNDRHYCVGN